MRPVVAGLVQYILGVARDAGCKQLHLDMLVFPGVGKRQARHKVSWDQIYRQMAQERQERGRQAAASKNFEG